MQDFSQRKGARRANSAKVIAFHLPQFHTIAENDAWWGQGFTEWTNVRQGKPNFDGHYQPHVPAEMGYYDLSDVATLARQAALAKEHGLEGFCFYYYWFDGKRLLERPVDQLLQHPEIDLPFCLCWANENWTRRWDGGDQEVLIAQSYDPALHERFARDLIPYFSDPRYIRIDGKPALLVYRGDIIPDLRATLAAWRRIWSEAGIGEVYLIGIESFRVFHPQEAGFDANCEFLPHQVDRFRVAPDEPLRHPLLPVQFLGDYNMLADYWSERPRPEYKRFRSIVPSWDNSSRRRKGGAGVFINATPERYGSWLERTLERTCEEFEGDERLVFINAWNEWGEGCHLEPDVRHGRAYLEATRDALKKLEMAPPIDPVPFSGFLDDYRSWYASRVLAKGEQASLPTRLAAWPRTPRVVIVVDARGACESLIRQTLGSLERQLYVPSEVWLCGAAGTAVTSSLPLSWRPDAHDWAALDQRLKQAEEADWALLLRAGDELDTQALLLLAERVVSATNVACCYFDEDRLDDGGERVDPFLKPDFNLDFMRSYPYCGRVLAFECKTALAAGGFDGRLGELNPHDLLWRLLEQRGFNAIEHIAEVVVHCRHHLGLWLAEEAVREAIPLVVSAHLSRLGIGHTVSTGALPLIQRVTYQHAGQPLVSIILRAGERLPMLQRCLESLLEHTRYPNYEILVAASASLKQEGQAWFTGLEALKSNRLRVLQCDAQGSSIAQASEAVSQARGEYVLFLASDVAAVDPGWLEAMLNHARRPEVGIVGARLTAPDGSVRHAGLVLGLGGVVGRAFEGSSAQEPGYMHRLLVDQNYSAVTGDCMMIRSEIYHELGGLDLDDLGQSLATVDFCLKAREAGYLTVWTPYAELLQGSTSETSPVKEEDPSVSNAFYARWLPEVARDPAYSPALSLRTGFTLESASERLPWQPFSQRAVPSFLCYAADRFGSGQYRVIQPLTTLEQAGFAQGGVSEYLATPAHIERMRPDAIILQRQYGRDSAEHIKQLKALSPSFRVFELDDYILELPERSVHRVHFGKDVVKRLGEAVALCDRFVVSTEPLAEALRHMHPDIRVAPNRLPPHLWSVTKRDVRQGKAKPRVGWAGGAGHDGDLALLSEVVKRLAGEVDWVFLGACPGELLPYVSEYHLGVPFGDYPRRLAALDLDLALAPLENNRFNVCKSNLRLLEYGACGFPVVCSDIEPTGGTFGNSSHEQYERLAASHPRASRRSACQLTARCGTAGAGAG